MFPSLWKAAARLWKRFLHSSKWIGGQMSSVWWRLDDRRREVWGGACVWQGGKLALRRSANWTIPQANDLWRWAVTKVTFLTQAVISCPPPYILTETAKECNARSWPYLILSPIKLGMLRSGSAQSGFHYTRNGWVSVIRSQNRLLPITSVLQLRSEPNFATFFSELFSSILNCSQFKRSENKVLRALSWN